MARITKYVVITDEGRDKGKCFLVKEMSALQAEKWAARAWLALAHSGLEIPQEFVQAGFAGLALATINMVAHVKFEQLEPLLDEMMRCVRIMPDRANPDVVRDLVDNGGDGDDIEEVSTRLKLRGEVFNLHTGPFMAAFQLKSIAPQSAPPSS